jgi:hypothetical protein
MPSLLLPLPCHRVIQINIDGSYGLACSTGIGVNQTWLPLYSMFRFMFSTLQDHSNMLFGTWRTT